MTSYALAARPGLQLTIKDLYANGARPGRRTAFESPPWSSLNRLRGGPSLTVSSGSTQPLTTLRLHSYLLILYMSGSLRRVRGRAPYLREGSIPASGAMAAAAMDEWTTVPGVERQISLLP